MKLRISLLSICILFSVCSFAKESILRVRIEKGKSFFYVSGLDVVKRIFKTGEKKFYPGQSKIRFNCDLDKNSNLVQPRRIYSISSPSGVINISGKKYFGRVDVISSYRKKGCDLVNVVSMEKYISTLLAHEMNSSWPLEALKAQSVAARSYALNKMKSNQVSKLLGTEAYYDLESSEKHQVSGNLLSVTKRTMQAALETKGEVLVNSKGKLKPIFFHARCGGQTFLPKEIWGNKVGSYEGVDCKTCKATTKGDWKYFLSNDQLSKFLSWAMKKTFDSKEKIRLVQDNLSKNYLKVYYGSKPYKVTKNMFRKFFGRFRFYSNLFEAKAYSSGFMISGKGHGHGVGMCQIGALGQSQKGKDYKDILKHYFPKLKLVKRYK